MTQHTQKGFEEDCVLEVQLHDLRTGFNLTDQVLGSEDRVWGYWWRTAQLLASAGFIPGWRPGADYGGSVGHTDLLKEAVYRVVLAQM